MADSLKYQAQVNLSEKNSSHTQLVLLAGRDKRVLEVGPATGYITDALSKRGCRVTCIENDPDAAEIASRFAERMIVGDIEAVDLAEALGDEPFDVVMFGDVLEHLVDPHAVLERVKTVLSPDGCVLASVPNVAHGSVRLALLGGEFPYTDLGLLDRTHLRFFTRETLAELFDQAGYKVPLWHPIVIDLFDTELGLHAEDYPPYLVEAILHDDRALVYQWVIRALPYSARAPGKRKPANGRAPAIGRLWQTTHNISRLRIQIDRHDAALREREALLGKQKSALEEANVALATIQASAGYRMLERYRRGMHALFPPGSRRGLPYRTVRRAAQIMAAAARGRGIRPRLARARRLVRRSGEIIRQEGWREFIRKVRRRVQGQVVPPVAAFIPIGYEEWILATEPDAMELIRQADAALKLPYRPLISIITPIWNPTPAYLRQTIDCVIAQTYDNWELCLADGASSDPEVRQVLSEYAASDDRIHVKLLKENFGIAGNSNQALAIATGEYVAYLDHTDLIQPEALWEVVTQLNRNPTLDCLYSDEDFVSEDGRTRFNPFFKPQWSPDIMLSANYLAHFRVLRRTLIEAVGSERPEMDGAQDWDLLLRLTETTQRIARIPKVLYHWRMEASSAAGGMENKPYAAAAQIKAVQGHLERCSTPGLIEQDSISTMRIKWRVSGKTRVSIIIPTRHNRKLLESCLRGIARAGYRNWEVIVIETAGRSEERERWYEQVKSVAPLTVLWWEEPFNYSAVNNFGASAARGDVLLFLNDDTEGLSPDWLDDMVGWSEQPGIGVVGAQLLSPDGTIQHGGDVVGLFGLADHVFAGNHVGGTVFGSTRWYRNTLAATGACLMIRRDLFESIGGFDTEFLLCGSDVDLCLRARGRGLRTVITPFARVLHHERATRGSMDYAKDCYTAYWRYQSFLHGGDPYFNPNLSILSTTPQIRHPAEASAAQVVSPVIGRQVAPQAANAAAIESESSTLAQTLQFSPAEIEETRKLRDANSGPLQIQSINWFIPGFENPFYAGMHTILRFADHFKREFGVQSRFIVFGSGPEPYIRSALTLAFPSLAESEIVMSSFADEDIAALPEADAAVASLWVTAYAVSKFKKARRKFYQIQDFEPAFYPAGTLYALSEATYRMGLYGLANTTTLKRIYEEDYGGKAVGFTPCVDTSLFHPPEGPRHEDDTFTVFLYGRPSHWRNCYELAIAAIDRLKRRMKRKIRVVSAGSWSPSSDSESAYLVDNLGVLDYAETAKLYRTCDAGLVLSVSKHPSYLPLELMASGALVVSNVNPAGAWLLRDGENCLLAEPTADSLAAALERGLLDAELRKRLTAQAMRDIQERHSDWAAQINKVYAYMCNPEGK